MNQMTPAQFADAIEDPEVIILDVRTPAEYVAGHIDGAINFDIHSHEFQVQLSILDKQAHYAVYCRSGNRSSYACQDMLDIGITNIDHLENGIIAWVDKNYPVIHS
jgi:rhodanese-related sulfurtransferase